MRKSTKFLGTLAVAGLVAAGGSAFTASNDFTAVSTALVGYGQQTNTGAVVTAVSYVPLSTDHSELDSVVFTTSTTVTGMTASMTLKNAGTVVGSFYACVIAGSPGSQTITCDASAVHPLLNTFDSTGLTVIQ